MPVFTAFPANEQRCAANFAYNLDARPKPLVAAQTVRIPSCGPERTRWRQLRECWNILDGRTRAAQGVDTFMLRLESPDLSSMNSVFLRRCVFAWNQPGLQLEFNGSWQFRFPITDNGKTEPDTLFLWHCNRFASGVRQVSLRARAAERIELELYDGDELLHEDPLREPSEWERDGNRLQSDVDRFTFGFRYFGEEHALRVARPFRANYCEVETSGSWVMSLHGNE